MKTYRAAVIGATGRGDYGHAVDVAFTKVPGVEVVAIADSDAAGLVAAQKRVAAPKAYADYREMLAREKPDIVGICPRWIDQHHDMLIAAAEAGCHVYMEKPFCQTLTQCDAVMHELQMRHLKLGIAHVSQYSPVLDMVLEVIKAGAIGDVLEIRGRGKEDHRGGGEDMWVLGSHVFGLMNSLAGNKATECSAVVTAKDQAVTKADVVQGDEGIGLLAGDNIQARFRFPGGIYGHFASRRGMGANPARFGVQVFGSRGILEMYSGYLEPAYILQDGSWSPGRTGKSWEKITSAGIGQPEPRTDGTYEGGHIAAIKDLIHSIETQTETRCSAEDSRNIIEMIAAVFESHRVGGPVELPLQTRDNPLSLL
jgi:predicted dehydrogenase